MIIIYGLIILTQLFLMRDKIVYQNDPFEISSQKEL